MKGVTEMISEPRINACEYERVWITQCPTQQSTAVDNMIVYKSYSCALHFCRYPQRECDVKKE